jgi:hypothetical protein
MDIDEVVELVEAPALLDEKEPASLTKGYPSLLNPKRNLTKTLSHAEQKGTFEVNPANGNTLTTKAVSDHLFLESTESTTSVPPALIPAQAEAEEKVYVTENNIELSEGFDFSVICQTNAIAKSETNEQMYTDRIVNLVDARKTAGSDSDGSFSDVSANAMERYLIGSGRPLGVHFQKHPSAEVEDPSVFSTSRHSDYDAVSSCADAICVELDTDQHIGSDFVKVQNHSASQYTGDLDVDNEATTNYVTQVGYLSQPTSRAEWIPIVASHVNSDSLALSEDSSYVFEDDTFNSDSLLGISNSLLATSSVDGKHIAVSESGESTIDSDGRVPAQHGTKITE